MNCDRFTGVWSQGQEWYIASWDRLQAPPETH